MNTLHHTGMPFLLTHKIDLLNMWRCARLLGTDNLCNTNLQCFSWSFLLSVLFLFLLPSFCTFFPFYFLTLSSIHINRLDLHSIWLIFLAEYSFLVLASRRMILSLQRNCGTCCPMWWWQLLLKIYSQS